ncbi:MAG: 3-hydroxyisobutyrate dehydrogenase [Hyphomicrobiaceae bacterium]
MSKIGFIGLGNMGAPMALNLMKAGHDVGCFDVSQDAREAAKSAGLSIAQSNAQAADSADVVILMLPNGNIAVDVVGDILSTMAPGSLLIDCSTIDVTSAKKIHALAETANIMCLDAPVSGGVGGASAGSLTFMVGGMAQAFEKGSPLFDVMGQKAVHCGDGSGGQAAKICNNMLLGISMIGTCEAFLMADKLGLSKSALFDVLSTSSGSCWSVNTYCPVPGVGPESPADNGYKAGFAAALMLKDLSLAQDAAQNSDAPTPLGRHAQMIYQAMSDAGQGGEDFSSVIRFLKSHQSKEIDR